MILLFIMHALFALTFPLTKLALANCQPLFFTAIRMIIGGVILVFYQYLKYNKSIFKDLVKNSLKYINYIIVLAIFNVFIVNATETWALKYISSANACFIYSITPFISAILSYFLLTERITKKKFLGMAIGTTGFIFMLYSENPSNFKNLSPVSWPELAMIVASFATSYGWIAMRQLIKKLKLNSSDQKCTNQQYSDDIILFSNSSSMIIGGIISLLFSLILEDKTKLININKDFILSTMSIILVSNIICYNLYAYLLKRYSATLISFVGFIEPIFAAIYGYILLGEVITTQFVIACIIIIIGLYIFYSEDLKTK